MVCGVCGGLSG